jgi:hypothetical protein
VQKGIGAKKGRKHNGEIHAAYNSPGDLYAVCHICWDGPPGSFGNGWTKCFSPYDRHKDRSEMKHSPLRRARQALSQHIRWGHGFKPVIEVKGVN